MPVLQVVCSRCSQQVPVGTLGLCPACGGILRPEYAAAAVSQLRDIEPGRGIDRYRAVLPVETPLPNLGEGDTPLIRSRRLGADLSLDEVYFKHEGLNPSGAFKDRAGAMAAALALDAGAKGVLSASSGNASSALSMYCAAAGLDCLILLEPGNPVSKLRQTLATGAQVIPVDGIFSQGPDALRNFLQTVAARIGYYLGFVWAPVNPYILEGIKTIAYEVVARLSGVPDVVVAPVGGGDMFAAQWRGYLELQRAGIIEDLPRMVAVQSLSAPPLLKAFEDEAEQVQTLPAANSKVSGINVPFTGDHALDAVRASGGSVIGVPDGAIFTMQGRMALEEGVWVEPAGAAAMAALPGLLAGGLIGAGDRIVCILSGAGFKDRQLATGEAQIISQQQAVAFDVEAVVDRVGDR